MIFHVELSATQRQAVHTETDRTHRHGRTESSTEIWHEHTKSRQKHLLKYTMHTLPTETDPICTERQISYAQSHVKKYLLKYGMHKRLTERSDMHSHVKNIYWNVACTHEPLWEIWHAQCHVENTYWNVLCTLLRSDTGTLSRITNTWSKDDMQTFRLRTSTEIWYLQTRLYKKHLLKYYMRTAGSNTSGKVWHLHCRINNADWDQTRGHSVRSKDAEIRHADIQSGQNMLRSDTQTLSQVKTLLRSDTQTVSLVKTCWGQTHRHSFRPKHAEVRHADIQSGQNTAEIRHADSQSGQNMLRSDTQTFSQVKTCWDQTRRHSFRPKHAEVRHADIQSGQNILRSDT